MRSDSKSPGLFYLLILLGAISVSSPASADDVWTPINVDELETRMAPSATPWIRPDAFSAFALEPSALDVVLAASPVEFTLQAEEFPAVVTLPRPDGGFERFSVVESPVMHPDLEERMADEGWRMKTYRGTSLDSPSNTVRFDWADTIETSPFT